MDNKTISPPSKNYIRSLSAKWGYNWKRSNRTESSCSITHFEVIFVQNVWEHEHQAAKVAAGLRYLSEDYYANPLSHFIVQYAVYHRLNHRQCSNSFDAKPLCFCCETIIHRVFKLRCLSLSLSPSASLVHSLSLA